MAAPLRLEQERAELAVSSLSMPATQALLLQLALVVLVDLSRSSLVLVLRQVGPATAVPRVESPSKRITAALRHLVEVPLVLVPH